MSAVKIEVSLPDGEKIAEWTTTEDGRHIPSEEIAAPPSKTYRLVHFHREDGVRVAVVGEPGRKWVYACTFDSPIRLLKLPLEEQRFMKDITETTVQKAAKKMLTAGKRLGITDGARAFLRAVQ